MDLPKNVVDARMAAFVEACRRKGLKVTHQRLEVYRATASTEDHPDADAVYRQVKRIIPTIALDTVYRNLRFLAANGLLDIVGPNQDRLRFDANLEQHHHFVCVQCKKIRDFTSPALAELAAPTEAAGLGDPLTVRLEVTGVCRECRDAAAGS